jgi:uncharacterized membrane protein YcaP (DUF421 family)
MQSFYNFVGPLLGLGAEPKDLTFAQFSMRGVIVFVFTLVIVRLGDKRSLSKKSAFDAALLIILASVLSRAINGTGAFFATLGDSAVLVALHRLLAYCACRSERFRLLIKGHPDVIVRDGKFLPENIRRNQVSEEGVREDMRLRAEIEDIEFIHLARLECSRDTSFIKK